MSFKFQVFSFKWGEPTPLENENLKRETHLSNNSTHRRVQAARMMEINFFSAPNPGRTPPARNRFHRFFRAVALVVLLSSFAGPALGAIFQPRATWAETLLASRAAWRDAAQQAAQRDTALARLWEDCQEAFPVACEWARQDFGENPARWIDQPDNANAVPAALEKALTELGDRAASFRAERDAWRPPPPGGDGRWLTLYAKACEARRALRLQVMVKAAPRVVFTKHRTLRPSFFAYTEGQSDAQSERNFTAGAELCLLEMDGTKTKIRTLLSDRAGAIRDPAVSWDGERVMFAWKKSDLGDDYHLYEMEVASGKIRQLTFGLGFADYEPAYLPSGDIVFSSTRCVQTVDCWWTEVSNLYTCDSAGRHLRRLGFDQVHTVFPTVMDDGRVIYTRWDYNDRGQVFPQALFQMNQDGTGQAEFYGNNSWFPTTTTHARGIPGSQKVLAILCGHHSTQAGKLAVIDPARGRQENQGVQLVAPVRVTPADRIDSYGQQGELFQYPYPLSERECLVGYAPLGWEHPDPKQRRRGDADFGIYWMAFDGRRELLAQDPSVACQQPVPLAARVRPAVRPSVVDYRLTNGTYYVQDVYAGASLAGVPRGTIPRLRVVAVDFRPAGVGDNGSTGPGGGALISTPIAIGNGAWDVKTVLGDATVHADGSAFFTVPARMPVYFQALDAKGRAVQTMRSWSTLQPGENQSCVGCHENKNSVPPVAPRGTTLAFQAGAQALTPFQGPPRGFSFAKEIQPILDLHCVRCHNNREEHMKPERNRSLVILERDPIFPTPAELARLLAPELPPAALSTNTQSAFSLLGEPVLDRQAKRQWSEAYLNLTLAWGDRVERARGQPDGRMVNWIGSQSVPAPLPPCAAGSTRSELLARLEAGHHGVRLSGAEFERLACWMDLLVPFCGSYTEASAWTAAEQAKYDRYLAKRQKMEAVEQENIREFMASHGKTVR